MTQAYSELLLLSINGQSFIEMILTELDESNKALETVKKGLTAQESWFCINKNLAGF